MSPDPATTPALAGIPREFWPRAAAAAHRLLMLDYDGTIAPLRVDRKQTAPDPVSVGLLKEIASGRATTLVIVSGRPVREIEPALGPFSAQIVGEHGWEARAPGGELVCHPIHEASQTALCEAAAMATALGWARCLEIKRASVVLHTRGLPPEEAAKIERICEAAWRRWAGSGPLRLARVNGGLELRVLGRDKGTAVEDLVRVCVPGTLPVYVGDDETDEDAFGQVRELGLGVRVGPPRPDSRARARLESLEEVGEFLRMWLALIEGRP
ncbi:MAG TPA: trehalose-phosphatase [Candidatus Polarisedimenticolia bacterium]|nr:trehalose-phosphatase [Candidatus Polarisedimenticolia bacterium]